MAMAPMTWHTVAWLEVLIEAIKADLQSLTPGRTSEAQLVDIANRIKRVQAFMRGHRRSYDVSATIAQYPCSIAIASAASVLYRRVLRLADRPRLTDANPCYPFSSG